MSTPGPTPRLILASTSPYRRELLARLRLPFEIDVPEVDEAAHPGELPPALAKRLATTKAAVVAALQPGAWVIGSDQVAVIGDTALGKPRSRAVALDQLAAMSGRSVEFLTAVSLVRSDGQRFDSIDVTTVHFRHLHPAEIARYIDAEQPFDCAGSFKSEGLGIALFEAIDSRDPTALIGLPLIATARLLRQAGFALP